MCFRNCQVSHSLGTPSSQSRSINGSQGDEQQALSIICPGDSVLQECRTVAGTTGHYCSWASNFPKRR